MGGYLVFFPRVTVKSLAFGYIIDVPAWMHMLFWFLLQTFLSSIRVESGNSDLAWFVQLAGFFVGLGLAWSVQRDQRRAATSQRRE